MKLVTAPAVADRDMDSQLKREYPHQEIRPPPYLESSYDSKFVGNYGHRCQSNTGALPPPMGILGSNVPSLVQRVDFEMFVDDNLNERYHVYTRIQSEIGSSSKSLKDVAGWRTSYPRLASFRDEGQLHNELLLFEVNLNLLREYPPPGSHLGINLYLSVNKGVKYREWFASTHIYEKGVLVDGQRRGTEPGAQLVTLEIANVEESTGVVTVKGSTCPHWWARNVFGEILDRKSKARAQGDGIAIQQEEERGRQFLEDMSMMQEIWATSDHDVTAPQRITTLLWKFRQTRDFEAASTTWRKLNSPSQREFFRSSAQSPMPLPLQPPMALGSSLQDLVMIQPEAAYANYIQQASLFVDNPESIITGRPSDLDSTVSTPTPDVRSLPSSIGTSLTSSLSESHDSLLREALFNSQDSANSSYDDGLDSQEAIYPTDDAGYHSQNAIHYTPDLEYLSQKSCYPDPSQAHKYQHGYREAQYQLDEDYMHIQPSIVTPSNSSHDQSLGEQDNLVLIHDLEATRKFARRLSYQPETGYHQEISAVSAEAIAAQDFTGGQINILFADEAHKARSYDQNPLLSPPNILSCRDGSDSQYQEPFQESHQPDSLDTEAKFNDELQSYPDQSSILPGLLSQDEKLLVREAQYHDQHSSLEPLFSASTQTSPPLHHASTNSLVLHHPQPQASLQQHIDSAQWKIHALWTNLHPQSHDGSENFEMVDETMKFESVRESMLDEVPEIVELDNTTAQLQEQEQGRILGEFSERLERELERELGRELEREVKSE